MMYRSASTNRVIGDDPYSSYYNSASASTSKFPSSLRALSLETSNELLPTYNSVNSETFKKEKSRAKFVENAVHLIPVVLIICALILWFGSHPVNDMQGKNNSSAAANIEGLSIEGDVDSIATTSDQTTVLPVHLGDLKPDGVQDGTDVSAERINQLHDGSSLH